MICVHVYNFENGIANEAIVDWFESPRETSKLWKSNRLVHCSMLLCCVKTIVKESQFWTKPQWHCCNTYSFSILNPLHSHSQTHFAHVGGFGHAPHDCSQCLHFTHTEESHMRLSWTGKLLRELMQRDMKCHVWKYPTIRKFHPFTLYS